jgi:L-malate glycosyltransferase
MKILIVTPSRFPTIAGNAVTTERWRRTLTLKGITLDIVTPDELSPDALADRLQNFRPDLVHIHHAFKTAGLILDPRIKPRLASFPIVVSPGGTDLNLYFHRADARETIRDLLSIARIIIAQSQEIARDLREKLPEIGERIALVPKGFSWFGNEPCDLRKLASCNSGDVLFFMPAGVRPVKGNVECLLALERVHAIRPRIRFAAAGPPVDAEYASRFQRELNRLGAFARWVGCIPPEAIHSAYKESDIVVNTSFSEGLSNSLLEAIAAEKPILASDIPGNREPVLGAEGDPSAGCLFDPRNPEDFVQKAIRLIDDESLRKELSAAAGLRKQKMPSAADETEGLLTAYRIALGTS